MLVSQKIVDAFNVQIGNELGASNHYVAIASYFSILFLMLLRTPRSRLLH